MCLEGVLFKSLPGGGNELFESLSDSQGIFKIFPLHEFYIWFVAVYKNPNCPTR